MGIVNPPEVHPAIVRALYRLCLQLGADVAVTLDEYVAMLAPASAVNDGADPRLSVRLTVREAVDIGVLEPRGEADPERYGLALPAPPDGADTHEVEAFFMRELRRAVFAPSNNDPLFAYDQRPGESDEPVNDRVLDASKAREFTRIQAWLLLQDPTRGSLSWAAKTEQRNVQRLQSQYPEGGLVINGTRWNGFRRWSLYLGLSRQDGQTAVIADPTRAVADELACIHDARGEMALVDLRTRLAERLPVLDGGTYRKEVLDHIDAEEDARSVSPALTLALLRAQRAGTLRLERRADFSGGSLTVGQVPVTHVVFAEAR
jgi:hypothetical protein